MPAPHSHTMTAYRVGAGPRIPIPGGWQQTDSWTTCSRCGYRRLARKTNVVRDICGDCQWSDPLYVSMVTNRTENRMSRIPWGAEALIDQVRELYDGEVTVDYSGEPDGLDVIREITLDKEVGEWLHPLLTVDVDPRITDLELTKTGLTITFTGDVRADNRDSYQLGEVAEVFAAPMQVAELPELTPVTSSTDPEGMADDAALVAAREAEPQPKAEPQAKPEVKPKTTRKRT